MSMGVGGPASAPAPRVFISYRREETAGHAGRLYDAMVTSFGEGNVFMDIDMAPGIDFVERITEAVSACRVLLVIMGPRWATLSDGKESARIAEPEDFVRLEVETALRNPEVTVIPVLVAGARMPDPTELPEGIRPLGRHNAIELSDQRWRYDVGRLVSALEGQFSEAVVPEEIAPAPPSPEFSPARLLVEGIVVAAVIAMATAWFLDAIDPFPDTDVGLVLERVATWTPVAVALSIWLTLRDGERTTMSKNVLLGLVVGVVAAAVSGTISRVLAGEVANYTAAIPAFAALGAGLGGLVGWLWVPSRTAAGVVAGTIGGALSSLAVDWPRVLAVGFRAVAIAGLALAVLLALTAGAASSAPKAEAPR
jgi:hypothetical protein